MTRKFAIILMLVTVLTSCSKNIESLNVDVKNPSTVPSYLLFTSSQKKLVDLLTTPNVNSNVLRLVTQQWQETTYTDESNYDFQTRPIPDRIWNWFYRDVLRDLKEAKKLIPVDVADANVQKNQIAITDIMEVLTWYYLATTYGDVPYSQALNVDNFFPKYDDDAAVFDDLLTRLDADIAALNTGAASFGTSDLIYGGAVGSWKKFANSLKLIMALTIADVNSTKAKAAAESAVASGVFTSNTDNAVLNYFSSPPNTNPIWEDQIQAGRTDFVAAKTITDIMNAQNDPRIGIYFTVDVNGLYSGGDVGSTSSFDKFSKPVYQKVGDAGPASTILGTATAPALILDHAEV